MEVQEMARFEGLVRRINENEGKLLALTIDELHELRRLLHKRFGEMEFGFPICGDD